MATDVSGIVATVAVHEGQAVTPGECCSASIHGSSRSRWTGAANLGESALTIEAMKGD